MKNKYMKKETFIDELAETVERLWDDAPPRIVLDGWWWKRYIPFFQRQQGVIQKMWDDQWGNGGQKDHKERMEWEKADNWKEYWNDGDL